MKRIYWRPTGASTNALLVIAAMALSSMMVVEFFPEKSNELYLQQMLEASSLAQDAMEAVRAERRRRGLPIDPIADPSGSGLIGSAMTPVTSNTGNLLAKQTTVNPNWAAVAVQLLREAGVTEGDTVAVGVSGSFPALNVSIYAAMTTLRLEPIIISSASASQWGANDTKFLWLDIEQALKRRKVFSFSSIASSLGGADDRAGGVSEEGRTILLRAINRAKLRFIDPENYADSVVARLAIYNEAAGGKPIKAYINVGGGTSSVGVKASKFAFEPGVNRRTPPKAALIDSVMARFLDQDIPVIHFLQVNRRALRYGLPISPQVRPPVGTGQVFLQRRYSPELASGALALIIGSLFLFIRSGRGQLAFQRAQKDSHGYEPTI
jgi:poly-gamma-glutamate system protein